MDLINNNKTTKFGSYASIFSSEKILFHNDTLSNENSRILNFLETQNDISMEDRIGSYYIFNNNDCGIFSASRPIFISYNSLSIINSINYVNNSKLSDSNVIFSDKILDLNNSNEFNLIFNSGNQFLKNPHMKIISPFDFINRHQPSETWSKATTSDSLHGEWHTYLGLNEIRNWDFDYGEGLVFTWGVSKFKDPLLLKQEDIIKEINFENNWENFETMSSPILSIFNRKSDFDSGDLMAIIRQGYSYDWKIISSDFISVEEFNPYKISIIACGENTNEFHSKIFYYDDKKNKISDDFIFTGQDDTFDCKKFENNFLTPKDTKYIKIQFWTWQNNETNSYFWIDDIKIYDLQGYTENNTLDMPFKIEDSGNYDLFIRYFKNQKGGKIGIYLDSDLIDIISTEDQLNKFVWQKIDTFNLEKGKHKITLENIEGFNAVNIFALVPEEEMEKYEQEVQDLVENKRIIYILEAESDIYRENAIKSNKFRGEASNGEVLSFLPEGKAWQEIEAVKPSNYTLVLRGQGSFKVRLDNKTLGHVSTNNLSWSYFPLIELKRGNHNLEIYPESTFQPLSWNFTSPEQLQEWKSNTEQQRLTSTSQDLRAELYNSTWGWKTINSPLIPITQGNPYQWKFSIKGKNSYSVHVKISEYDENQEHLQTEYVKSINTGTFDWQDVEIEYTPQNTSTRYLQLQIWHGHETPEPLPNIIWLTNVSTYGYDTSYLDVVWLYSTDDPKETLEDIFQTNTTPATVDNFEQVNPTLWQVQLNATEPYMLSFAESYDPLWVAEIRTNDGLKQYEPVPLYSVINGFWIDETGEYEVTIRYKPQRWFYYGAAVSLTTLTACIGYLIYDWKPEFFKKIWARVKEFFGKRGVTVSWKVLKKKRKK
jgi:hypothetical protein